ncbi:hypothetical protein FOL46_003390 [Perkinsus olseni]|nr:hypothetical protein FOL46_003390 [Perkinsus olseni]
MSSPTSWQLAVQYSDEHGAMTTSEAMVSCVKVAVPTNSGWTLMNASAKDLPPGMEPGCLTLTPTQVTKKATETAAAGVYVFNDLYQASFHRQSAGQSPAPKLLLEAISEDFWGRQRHEGYGFIELPQVDICIVFISAIPLASIVYFGVIACVWPVRLVEDLKLRFPFGGPLRPSLNAMPGVGHSIRSYAEP